MISSSCVVSRAWHTCPTWLERFYILARNNGVQDSFIRRIGSGIIDPDQVLPSSGTAGSAPAGMGRHRHRIGDRLGARKRSPTNIRPRSPSARFRVCRAWQKLAQVCVIGASVAITTMIDPMSRLLIAPAGISFPTGTQNREIRALAIVGLHQNAHRVGFAANLHQSRRVPVPPLNP